MLFEPGDELAVVDVRHDAIQPQEVGHDPTLSDLRQRDDTAHPWHLDLPSLLGQTVSADDWTISRVTCPTCGHSWTDVHRVGALLTVCPECENVCETLTDPDEIAEIERSAGY